MFSRTLRLFLISVVAALLLNEVVIRLFVPVRNVGPSFNEYDHEFIAPRVLDMPTRLGIP